MHATDWEIATRKYPFRVRRYRHETADSFSQRTLAANFENDWDLRQLMKLAAERPEARWLDVISAKTGVDPHLFYEPPSKELIHPDATSCGLCRPGTGDQWMCRLCAAGQAVALAPHLEQFVCLKHRIWVGSGFAARAQPHVSERYLVAERQFQSLRRRGIADAWTLWELLFALDPIRQNVADRRVLPLAAFPIALSVWTLLANQAFVHALLAQPTYRDSFTILFSELRELGCDMAQSKRVWLLIRPAFLRALETSDQEITDSPAHEFHFKVGTPPQVGAREPFVRYLEASGARLTRHTWRGLIVPRNAGIHSRVALQQDAICMNGHRVRSQDCECERQFGPNFACCVCARHQR